MTPILVDALSHPVVGTLLLTLGALGLLSEAREPGPSLPGAAGLLGLGTVLAVSLAVDAGGWPGLLLLMGGAPLVTRGVRYQHVAWATGGILVAAAGTVWVLAGRDPSPLALASAGAMVGSALLLVLLTGWALWWRMPATRRPERLGWALAGPEVAEDAERAETADPDAQAGRGALGTAASALRPAGEAVIGGARVAVVSESGWVPEGAPVRVVAHRGAVLVVEPVGTDVPRPPPRGATGA